MILFVSMLIFGYLMGSLNFAIILCRVCGYDDPRTAGSLNPGATNVLRTAGKRLGVVVLILDALKAFIPVLLTWHMLGDDSQAALVGLAAFIGHLYPIFFRFQGGKGVATYIGVLFALSYPTAIFFCVLWLLVALTTGYSSLGAIAAATVSPLYLLWFGDYDCFFPVVVMLVFLLLKHKDNIRRLSDGTESRLNL